MAFPWISAGFLALTIALALVARRPREFDRSRFPMQVQQGGLGGIIFSVGFLAVFAIYVAWWSPAPISAAGVVLWVLAGLLPRFARLALEVISVVGWPWSFVLAAIALLPFADRVDQAR